ncbi:MAG TPA: hypothetical protein VFL13_00540, partial [Candidatus Baltobacteraceae bacterium]|nr:hypothetical protein [Candidatus Baltobacteraceae bacterium]
AAVAITASGYCQTGAVGSVYPSVGTSPVTYGVTFTDAAGKTVVAPGLPTIEIQDNTSTYQSTSGTINTTGGTVAFSINQSAQTFTLTPSSSSISGAAVNIKGVPPSGTDALSFAVTKSFSFYTGSAPPAHNFVAAVQQTGVGSGVVDFYNVSLGANTPGSDTFSAYSPASLAVTNSTNEGKADVNNPTDVAWDSNGDLLVANAGTNTTTDSGNMACVPAGAISTGANVATTVSTNAFNPQHLAYDSRDSSIALANNGTTAPYVMPEYTFPNNYVAASAPRNLAASGFGATAVMSMPSATAGTYAVALTTGAEEDPAYSGTQGTNKVAVYTPSGTETDIKDDTHYGIDKPQSLAWDNANGQLVIANYSVYHPLVSFYSASYTQVKTINTTNQNYLVATSPDGHVAVAWIAAYGYSQVQVYDNTATRAAVGGPIPFNATSDSGVCTNYIYGTDGSLVNTMKWLSNTKLLIGVQAYSSGAATSKNGLYIYDISNLTAPAGYDDLTCAGFSAAPTNTGFVQMTAKPLAAAFKT